MANKQTPLFLPEEHRIISTYLDVRPVEPIPNSLTLDVALSTLGLNKEVDIHGQEAYATAAILLERVQNRLPQWASVRDDQVTLGRNIRDRAAERTVELTPQFLLMINWADSGPGFSWPETYNVTYVPLYDVFVVTGSVDSTDIYGVTDFAIGHFSAGEDILKGSSEAIIGEWDHLASTYDQSRWAYVFDPGLITMDEADNLAGQVWKEDEEEDEDELPLAS
jgi:hypothetical protein